jgi:hypothetical protein
LSDGRGCKPNCLTVCHLFAYVCHVSEVANCSGTFRTTQHVSLLSRSLLHQELSDSPPDDAEVAKGQNHRRDAVMKKFNKGHGYEADSEVIYGDTDSVMVNFKVNRQPSRDITRWSAGTVNCY